MNRSKLTPMMQQYMDIKDDYPDALLFFRLGDFYEMFFDDALVGSRALEIALTQRDCGNNEKCPMCGIPYHVADEYIGKLISQGFKVAVCEQMEDPALAKGLVKRQVVQIYSPGMTTDADVLQSKENNYLGCIYYSAFGFGLSYIDISTGELKFTEFINDLQDGYSILLSELSKISPSEILVSKVLYENENFRNYLQTEHRCFVNLIDDKSDVNVDEINKHLKNPISGKALKKTLALISLSDLLDYVFRFEQDVLSHIQEAKYYVIDAYMGLDNNSRRNLELHRNINTNDRRNTLLSVLDQTNTSMGARLLAQYLERPLRDRELIIKRQDMIEGLIDQPIELKQIREILDRIYDLERIMAKVSYGRANGKDLVSLKYSIEHLPVLRDLIGQIKEKNIKNISENMDCLEDIFELIDASIVDDPPISITEGHLIKIGFNEKLDQIREASIRGREELIEFEKNERDRTKIRNLKVVYNKKTGYFIDVTKANLDRVPDDYRKVQTLTNSDRFVNARLDRIQDMILGSETETISLEYELFQKIREYILGNMERIYETTSIVAELDVYASLAKVARDYHYVRPTISHQGVYEVIDGRHPVVEKAMKHEQFIPNDCHIGEKDNRIHLITGPNMSGKSTYMRQNALIIIMAQMGSFVPAKSATVPIVDRIFTRIGASDNLSQGESTFMVEMREMATIIANATKDSFLILDEIGRGTSTYDGLSIAWAILEYLSHHIKAKTLFATHYHELTELENSLDNLKNKKVSVVEKNHKILFLRRIVDGKTDKSYGIEVAKLADFPEEILERAEEILSKIERDAFRIEREEKEQRKQDKQLDIASYQKDTFLAKLSETDINHMTPMEAMNRLAAYQKEAENLLKE